MNKKTHTLNPKKKEKEKPHRVHHHHHHHPERGLQEITKRSLLDVLRDNMKIAERVTFLHRMIYIGAHSFEPSDETGIQTVYEAAVNSINDKHCEEKLSGYILFYHKYFCVVMDGIERSLVGHLRQLLQQDAMNPDGPKFGKLKLLVAYHHVNQRLLKEWRSTSGKPPTLLEKLDPDADMVQTMSKMRYVIDKLYNLGMALRPSEEVQEEDEETASSLTPTSLAYTTPYYSRASIKEATSSSFRKTASSRSGVLPASDYYFLLGQTKSTVQFLPEYSVLEFLLSSPYTIDLRNFPKLYGVVPYLDSYQDLVWPVGCDFTPMNLQAQDIDPITELSPDVISK